MRNFLIVALLASCAKSAPAPQAAASIDPEKSALQQTWIIDSHMLVKGASVTDADATGFHGRTVVIGGAGFTSPFQPVCENATREKKPRELGELIDELALAEGSATTAAAAGMTSDLLEFRLTCADRGKPPPLIIWIGGKHAMTCSAGACYLMKHFDD